LAWQGITPVFCDIDPETLTLDPKHIPALITPQTTAILGVHLYGIPCDVLGIEAMAHTYGLKVIYDAAHAFGVTLNGQGIGTFGDATMFSFHATKLFHTVEGGGLAVNTPVLKQRVEALKNFGITGPDVVEGLGLNGKLNEVQAAIGLLVLDHLQQEKAKRLALFAIYAQELAHVPGITLLTPPAPVRPSDQYCVIRVDEATYGLHRDKLHAQLQACNVLTRRYFYPLCSQIPLYAGLPSAHPSQLPVAHQVVQQVLALPYYGELPSDHVRIICQLIKQFGQAA
jgi:dTDP-4-amino-4,6-dideoxygalactose transaminase